MSGRHTYSDGRGEWDVCRLWELAADLPVQEIDPEAFHEWEDWGWESEINLGLIASHMRRVLDADLSYRSSYPPKGMSWMDAIAS